MEPDAGIPVPRDRPLKNQTLERRLVSDRQFIQLAPTAQTELNGPAEAWALGKPAGPRTTRPRLAYGWSL